MVYGFRMGLKIFPCEFNNDSWNMNAPLKAGVREEQLIFGGKNVLSIEVF